MTAFVMNDAGEVLLERRSDNGRWGMPGGVQELGESITQTLVREVKDETGIEVTGLIGMYTDPCHVIEFGDGETRQEFSMCFRARPVGGAVTVSAESHEVRWIPRDELDTLNISDSTRRRLGDALAGKSEPVLA